MENRSNDKSGILAWLKAILDKILDSMKVVSENSVNMIIFIMFCAVLSYIAFGQQAVRDVERKSLDVDTVRHSVDSVTVKL